jgi:hypothetical protein
MTARAARPNESGIALITVLLVMMLVSGLAAGMFAAISADQKAHSIDRDQTRAYAAAHAGLEKLTADLAGLFNADFSPNKDQLNALVAAGRVPVIPGFQFTAPGGAAGSGYAISWTADKAGNPVPVPDTTITAGPYSGLKGLLTRYDITVTARSAGGSEVRLRRGLQTVAVPVFQFGVFSENDLTFYGGDDFDFGGRVHTNGNLWLSEASGVRLLFTDRVTAWGDVNRRYLSNGLEAATNGMSGNVQILTAIGNLGSARTLRYSPNESSVTNKFGGFWTTADPPVWNANGATTNNGNPSWTTVSQSYYRGNLINRHTGATVLRLPLVTAGASPLDLIRRPVVGSKENDTNPNVFNQRYFSMASLRILLSDRPEDITDLPTVTGAPVLLDGDWLTAPPAGYGPVDATHPPIARSPGPAANTTSNGSTFAAPYAQIRVTAPINAAFLAPAAMTITSALGVANVTNCTGRTISTFTGCTVSAPGIAVNGTLTATLPSGLVVSAATTLAAGAGANVTITLSTATNPQPTARFVPGLIWVNGNPVTCEGYSTSAPVGFTNCRGLTAAPGNNQPISTHATSAQNKGLIGGYIKVEKQTAPGVWSDVTMEILNLGIGAPNQEGAACGDPTPNAVLRIQRLRDNGNIGGGGPICTYAQSLNPHDWWPNALYDTREGNYRPGIDPASPMTLGGIVHYVGLDINNLRRWLAGGIGTTGTQAMNVNGYMVYFSDRRGDHNENLPGDPETGAYGFEDFVNPGSPAGVQNTTLDEGEDVNRSGAIDRYGETPHLLTLQQADWTGYSAPFDASARPWTVIANIDSARARVNRQVLFRRGLKLMNAGISGGATQLPAGGLTVASENIAYVHGNYNASNDPVANPNEAHVPAGIVADAVAILSNNWRDANSFRNPNNAVNRPATTTGYRFAVVTGKSLSFPYPTAGAPHFLFGTDGGAGNFLRMMEDWKINGVDLNYRGSMVSLFNSQQATGTFKYHGTNRNVYDYADRNFKFDDEFLQPTLLPPGTPMFRDVNLLTFRQILRPNQ